MTAKDFFLSIPDKVNPKAVEGLQSTFHFLVDDQQYTVNVADGAVGVSDCLEGDPKCTVKVSEQNLLAILNGNLNPMMAVFTGKLKIDNQGELLKYAKILGLM